jgi:hypothetical protein
MKKALTYGGGLIAIYLLTTNWIGSTGLLTTGAAGGVNVIKALQGRN